MKESEQPLHAIQIVFWNDCYVREKEKIP